jgi:hypothetical protein
MMMVLPFSSGDAFMCMIRLNHPFALFASDRPEAKGRIGNSDLDSEKRGVTVGKAGQGWGASASASDVFPLGVNSGAYETCMTFSSDILIEKSLSSTHLTVRRISPRELNCIRPFHFSEVHFGILSASRALPASTIRMFALTFLERSGRRGFLYPSSRPGSNADN